MQQLKPNTTLQGGKYRIERVLGQGGFGNTYVGVNTVFNEPVAIKEFFMQGINDRDEATGSITISIERNKEQFLEQLEKFKKEALRIRKLNNDHIVHVHDLFEENGTAYYVMDFIDGESLAERLKRTGAPMSEEEVTKILPQILDALKTVHDAGIWHLDLKPANIMIDKAGNVKLIDFGASKQLNAQKGGATTSTAISYTNGYAPREQMEQNYDKFGPWTDFYALGASLYNILTTNRPPMPSDIDDEGESAFLFTPQVSEGMKKIILKLMNPNRNKRPKSFEDIKLLLQNVEEISRVFEIQENREEPIVLGPNNEKQESAVGNHEKVFSDSEETILDLNVIVGSKEDSKDNFGKSEIMSKEVLSHKVVHKSKDDKNIVSPNISSIAYEPIKKVKKYQDIKFIVLFVFILVSMCSVYFIYTYRGKEDEFKKTEYSHMSFMGVEINGSRHDFIKSINTSTFKDEIFDFLGLELFLTTDSTFKCHFQGDENKTFTFSLPNDLSATNDISYLNGDLPCDMNQFHSITESFNKKLGGPKYSPKTLSQLELNRIQKCNSVEYFLIKPLMDFDSFYLWEVPLGYIIWCYDTSWSILFVLDKKNIKPAIEKKMVDI